MELIGRQFGHIRVSGVIGEGGMGAVYAGHDEKLDRKVALKVLHAEQRLDSEARTRLLREAQTLSRVDHPNICRIYDYIESGDVDLLVLEYIDGRTLQSAMDEGLPQAERMRIASTIAEVLVVAHRAGIVHRDLKPDNVMLTKTGAVKVLDFGLARLFEKGRKSSDSHSVAGEAVEPSIAATMVMPSVHASDVSPSGRAAFLATAAGIALGTPLYMSPEQARGEALTPASDMFSFGLLLQVLFTGKEPHPEVMSARDVILRVARGETNPVEGAPKDITVLVNNLKMLAPADRPTAVQAVERLRFLIAKPQRIARRAIAAGVALMMLFGVWRYTVDLDRERAVAVAARADAENLIEYMLGDLRKKLEPVGRLDILDDASQRALAYIGSHQPATMSNDALARSSKALNQLGEVRIGQGKLHDALALFKRSLSLAELALKREPDSAPAQLAVATTHFWIGDVYRKQGNLKDALAHYTLYMNGAEALFKAHPENDEYQLERGYGHANVASIYELQGEFSRALEHLRLTREVKVARVAAKPSDAERQGDLARTLNRIGFVLERSGDLRGARANYEQEFATYSRLVARDPQNSRWKHRLIVSHDFLARMFEMTGDVDAALKHRRAELVLSEQLAERDPENAQWQRNLAVIQMQYGDVLRVAGEFAPALKSIRTGEASMERLLMRKETVSSWHRDLATIQTAAAQAYLANGNAAAAEQSAAASVALAEPLLTMDAAMPRHIAESYLALGDARAAAGNAVRAREAWSTAVDVLSRVPAEQRTPELLDTLVRTLLRLDRRDEAEPLIEQLTRIGYRAPDFMRAIATAREKEASI